MCRLCARGETVEQFGHAESYACLRHGLWTGPQTDPQILIPVDERVRAAELRYRRLRRAGRVPSALVKELAVIVNRHHGELADPELGAGNYSTVVNLAKLLTDRSFQRDLLDPRRTFAQARTTLEEAVAPLLPGSGSVVVDGLWRLLRPAFLSLRDAIDNPNHQVPATFEVLGIDSTHWAGTAEVQRPMEPFGRYLELLESSLAEPWSNVCELTLVAGQSDRPRAASKQSAELASFICKQGHRHQRTLNTMFSALKRGRDGCPYCAGVRALAGFNSMAETHPSLARQWHPSLNAGKSPSNVSGAGNSRSYWWICPSGHEWQATPNNRAKGRGCPYCSGRRCIPGVTSLDVTHPRIASEWNHRLNGSLLPSEVSAGSGLKVDWICPKGHEYRTAPGARTGNGRGCPVCANLCVRKGVNDLATSHPHLADQWHPSLNGAVTPESVVAGSGTKYYWHCPAGHAYLSAVYSRKNGRGCPACARR